MSTKELMLQFYILSLDPKREDYMEQIERGRDIIMNTEEGDE